MLSWRRILSRLFQRTLLRVLGLVIFKQRIKPTNHYVDLIQNSGFLSVHGGKNSVQVSTFWNDQDLAWNNGEYTKSITNRKQILSELYQFNEVDFDDYYPPILSTEFTGPIGHHAMLGIHIAAQQIGLLPNGRRIAFRVISEEPKPLLDVFNSHVTFVKYSQYPSWTELPNNWHIAERLQLIKSKAGFIDLYEMIEKVFSAEDRTPENPFFTLPRDYSLKAGLEFESMGMNEEQWFVGLHIRNDGLKDSRRNQPLESYIKAISEITGRGGWVIRIGDSSMAPLPQMNNVIDLVKYPDAKRNLHPYVFANSKFFIGTCSGPSRAPGLFGVPTLITNTTSLGRNVLAAAKNSIYLPKIVINSNSERLSYEKVLSTKEAYSELEPSKLNQLGMKLLPNSEDDIWLATIEMFNRIDENKVYLNDNFLKRVLEIRKKTSCLYGGNFAISFLEKHQDWFLK